MTGPRTYAFASWLFLRLLGLIYLSAFASLATQIKGLAGRQGILPVSEVLGYRDRGRISRFWRLPTLCWLSTSDPFLLFLCWGGAVLAGFLTAGFAPLPILILLWLFYLSLFNVCRFFLGYQWDVLLLEAGFLAIFVAPVQWWPRMVSTPPPPAIIWLFWWLLFRLMFSSGFVKLRSGDKAWRSLTALCHHYQTQPLPAPAAWYVHQLPRSFHRISSAMVLLIELVGPAFIPGPAPARYIVCGTFIALMFLIELTGNYAFFNLLGAALSLLLLDDAVWRPVTQQFMPANLIIGPSSEMGGLSNKVVTLLVLVLLFVSGDVIAKLFRRPVAWPKVLMKLLEFLAPFRLVSSYGLFAVITTERPEIIIEGSDDGVHWLRYEFKWKPGVVERAPRFIAPLQPRLDWQMWFAALASCETNPWLVRFLVRLLEGSKPVIGLLKTNPFTQKPPRYIRGSLYDYRFTNAAQRKETRAWWIAEARGTYCPTLEIKDSQVHFTRQNVE